MILYEDIPEFINKRYTNWKSLRDTHLTKSNQAWDYYLNNVDGTESTLSQQQAKNMEDKLGFALTLNYLYPILDQKRAILFRNKFSSRIVGVDERFNKHAFILDKMKYAMMYSSEAVEEIDEYLGNLIVTGHGHLEIIEDEAYSPGAFGISIISHTNDVVIVDPNSRKKSGKDREGYFIDKEVTYEKSKEIFLELIENINAYYGKDLTLDSFTMPSGSGTGMGRVESNEDKKLWVRKYTDRIFTTMYMVRDIESGDVDRVFAENYPDEAVELIINPDTIIGEEKGMYAREHIVLGDKLVLRKIKPTNYLPLHTTYYEWGGKPYNSYGMVHFEKGKQKALDKAVATMILNGILTNNAGWKAPVGSIPEDNKEKWSLFGASPLFLKEYIPILMGNQVLVPEREQVQQLSNFFPMLIEILVKSIEYSTNINPIVTGNPESKIEVFSTVQQMQNSAMERMGMTVTRINNAMEYIGNVIIQMLIANINPKENYMFFDESGQLNEVQIATEISEQIKTSRFKVIAIPADAMPTQKMAMATELMKIAQTTPDPQERNVYVKKGFKLSGLRGFEELSDELNTVKQLNGQIEQMQEQIQRDEELMKQYENRALLAEYNMKKMELLSKLETDAGVTATELAKDKDIILLQDEVKKLEEQIKEKEKPKE